MHRAKCEVMLRCCLRNDELWAKQQPVGTKIQLKLKTKWVIKWKSQVCLRVAGIVKFVNFIWHFIVNLTKVHQNLATKGPKMYLDKCGCCCCFYYPWQACQNSKWTINKNIIFCAVANQTQLANSNKSEPLLVSILISFLFSNVFFSWRAKNVASRHENLFRWSHKLCSPSEWASLMWSRLYK